MWVFFWVFRVQVVQVLWYHLNGHVHHSQCRGDAPRALPPMLPCRSAHQQSHMGCALRYFQRRQGPGASRRSGALLTLQRQHSWQRALHVQHNHVTPRLASDGGATPVSLAFLSQRRARRVKHWARRHPRCHPCQRRERRQAARGRRVPVWGES